MNRHSVIATAIAGTLALAACSHPVDSATSSAHRVIDKTGETVSRTADRTAKGIENAAYKTAYWLHEKTRRLSGYN